MLLMCIVTCSSEAASAAQDTKPQTAPRITGVVVTPTRTDQCRPVRITFVLTNTTDTAIYSQRPYSGATYNLYQTFRGAGFHSLPGRYMAAISLDGGKDGYPYRWGFRGSLLPGKTTTIAGRLSFVEAGAYEITAGLLEEGAVAPGSAVASGSVTVDVCSLTEAREPVPARPIHPRVNGRVFPPMLPYVLDGHLYVSIRPFVYSLGANVYFLDRVIVIRRPGYELVLFPGRQNAFFNGTPVVLPLPTYLYGGVAYVSPRFIAPFLGASVYWEPYPRALVLGTPWVY